MTTPGLTPRPLGTTGLTVTPLGLGGAYLGFRRDATQQRTLDEELGIATVLRALELGITHLDTSGGYIGSGGSERIIGRALARYYERGGQRSDFTLSTKTGTRNRDATIAERYSGEATWRSIETSLELLQTDYLDIALVHDPQDLAPVLAPGGAWDALKEMKAQGIVRNIGLGVRSHELHRQIIATGECDVVLTHTNFHLLDRSAAEGVLEPAAAAGVGVLNGTSLYHGLLAGGDPREALERLSGARRGGRWPDWLAGVRERAEAAYQLWSWCQEWGVSLLALNLQFVARESRIGATLMGAANPEQIEADVKAMSVEIPEEMWAELPDRLP